ncbi:uncharacterized protein ISCGN_027000 [Ixodes scapularis]
MAAPQGRVPADFLPTPGLPVMPWLTWKRGFLNYLEATDADGFPPKRRRAILLSFLGEEGNRVVDAFGLAGPAVGAAQDEFQVLLSALDTHFASAQNVVVERRKFVTKVQGPGETVLEYLGALRHLASFCDYGESLESRVAEMFISGIRSAEVQDRLIRESGGAHAPSLERAVQLAQQFERTSRDCDLFRRSSLDATPSAPHVVERIQDGRGRDRDAQHGGQPPRRRGSSPPRRERPLPPPPSPSQREPSYSSLPRRGPPSPPSGREPASRANAERSFPPFPPRRVRDRRQSRAPSRPFFRARPRDPPPGARLLVRDDGCFFCGRRSHPRDECPASGATCFSCGREGHFANVCRSRPRDDRDQRKLALPSGRRASARGYYEHRQARPGPTRIQGITFPDYELPATIYTVAPPDDFPERCRFCGGRCQSRKFCPAAHRRCFSCQKQGHLDRVCESRPRWPRLDRGGPSNPPTVFASAHRRHREMRHFSAPRAPWSRPRGGALPPEPPRHAATGESPAFLLQGRNHRNRLHLSGRPVPDPQVPRSTVQQRLPQTIKKYQERMKMYSDRRHAVKRPTFIPGQTVKVNKPRHRGKLQMKYASPQKIQDQVGPATYRLDDGSTWHASKLTHTTLQPSSTRASWFREDLYPPDPPFFPAVVLPTVPPAPPEPPVPVLGPASLDTTNPDPEGPRPASSQSPEAPPLLPEGPVPAGSPPPVPEGPAEVQPVPEEIAQPPEHYQSPGMSPDNSWSAASWSASRTKTATESASSSTSFEGAPEPVPVQLPVSVSSPPVTTQPTSPRPEPPELQDVDVSTP